MTINLKQSIKFLLCTINFEIYISIIKYRKRNGYGENKNMSVVTWVAFCFQAGCHHVKVDVENKKNHLTEKTVLKIHYRKTRNTCAILIYPNVLPVS